MIYTYIRDKRRNKIGVVVALSATQIGWSLCNVKKGDKFDRAFGLKIAVGRAMKETTKVHYCGGVFPIVLYYHTTEPSRHVQSEMLKMAIRANNYFRNKVQEQVQ